MPLSVIAWTFHDVHQGAAEAVDPPDENFIALAGVVEQLDHLGSLPGSFRPRHLVDEDPLLGHAHLPKRLDLHGGILVGGADSGVAEFHCRFPFRLVS